MRTLGGDDFNPVSIFFGDLFLLGDLDLLLRPLCPNRLDLVKAGLLDLNDSLNGDLDLSSGDLDLLRLSGDLISGYLRVDLDPYSGDLNLFDLVSGDLLLWRTGDLEGDLCCEYLVGRDLETSCLCGDTSLPFSGL